MHYSPDSTDGEIEFFMVPYQTTFVSGGKEFTMTVATVLWKVSVLEEKWRVVKAPDEKGKKGAAKLAKLFSGMSTTQNH
jgi:hypothetical protein